MTKASEDVCPFLGLRRLGWLGRGAASGLPAFDFWRTIERLIVGRRLISMNY